MLVLDEFLAAPRMLSRTPVGAGPSGNFSGVLALSQGLDKAHRHGMDWLGGEEEAEYLPQQEEKNGVKEKRVNERSD